MEKVIKVNEKELRFKSSAATNILYKKAFQDDVLVKLTSYTKNLKELKSMQAKITELRKDETKQQEEILSEMNALMTSDIYVSSQAFMSETLPRLAYIMWLEANTKIEDIFHKLNEEQYLIWLMGIDQDELLAVTGEVMELWQAGAKQHSKPKN